MDCDAQQPGECLFMPSFGCFCGILTSKIGHTDLVFSVRSVFISRPVNARLQVSVCSGYDLCQTG